MERGLPPAQRPFPRWKNLPAQARFYSAETIEPLSAILVKFLTILAKRREPIGSPRDGAWKGRDLLRRGHQRGETVNHLLSATCPTRTTLRRPPARLLLADAKTYRKIGTFPLLPAPILKGRRTVGERLGNLLDSVRFRHPESRSSRMSLGGDGRV